LGLWFQGHGVGIFGRLLLTAGHKGRVEGGGSVSGQVEEDGGWASAWAEAPWQRLEAVAEGREGGWRGWGGLGVGG
jgi:hypothetical protein